ncbi:MAG TPA: rhomboid family intramembrane serine protease [Kofleriaceae bacterium]|jgi:rhomboid protease GluP
MYYELALIAVAVAAGYWGSYFVRGQTTRTYGAMLLAAAALAAIGMYGRKIEDAPPWCGLAGAIGLGAAGCLLVVGPLIRAAARRFAANERFAIALRLLDVADVLAPGSGVTEEKALLAAMREISGGHIDQTIGALTAAKDRAPAEAKLAIDERIAMLYLAAYRWDDAIAHAEAHLFGADVRLGELTAPASPAVALRRALGVAPPVWVELLGAYGYKGDLEQAARMLARLEDVCAGRDDAAIWVHRGRMMFLALAGRVAAVEALVAPRAARHMSRSARTYWYAVALERHGDGRAAHAAYEKARAQSRGRPRQLIERALERMPDAQMIEVPPIASELIARVEGEAPPAVALPAAPVGPWATRGLVISMLAWAAVIALFVGDSNDAGVAMRGGALVRAFVEQGEWWRFISSLFVHVGGLHLFVNVAGLWMLGRLCEELFGPARTIAIAAVAGIVGAFATYAASPVDVAAGSSAAVLGVLGAVFAELTLHRERHRVLRKLAGRVALVTAAMLGVVFIDPSGVVWGHCGGLLAGAITGLALSPSARWAKPARLVAIAIAGAFGGACIAAAVLVVRTPLAASFGPPTHAIDVDTVSLHGPASFTGGPILDGPGLDGRFSVGAGPQAFTDWTAQATDEAHHEFEQVDVATAKLVPLPVGWQGEELVVSADNADGAKLTWRRIVAGKSLADGRSILAVLDMPEGMARAVPALFTNLLASADAR